MEFYALGTQYTLARTEKTKFLNIVKTHKSKVVIYADDNTPTTSAVQPVTAGEDSSYY